MVLGLYTATPTKHTFRLPSTNAPTRKLKQGLVSSEHQNHPQQRKARTCIAGVPGTILAPDASPSTSDNAANSSVVTAARGAAPAPSRPRSMVD